MVVLCAVNDFLEGAVYPSACSNFNTTFRDLPVVALSWKNFAAQLQLASRDSFTYVFITFSAIEGM